MSGRWSLSSTISTGPSRRCSSYSHDSRGWSTHPCSLLCLARPELLEQRPEWPVTIGLQPLGADDVDALLESLDAPAAARVRLAREAAGNPLYAEELVAWVRDGGDPDELPTSLNALLGARLDQLERGERDALERGAVEGELFHQAAVLELTEQPSRPAVAAGLDELSRKELIRLTAASLAGELIAYRFKHILVRDAAYRTTTKKLRATLHERYADWLEHRAGSRVGEYHEILGYHLEQAYRYHAELGPLDEETRALGGRAAGHLARAGERAVARSDLAAAASLLERALALGITEPRERARLQGELSYPLFEMGRGAEAESQLTESVWTATRLGERGLATRLQVQLWVQQLWSDPYFEPVEHERRARQAIETFRELGDQSGLANAERLLGRSLISQGRHSDALAALERALVHAEAAGDQVARRRVVGSIGMQLCFGPTPVGAGIRRGEELREAHGNDRVLEAAITRHLSYLYAMAGRAKEALEAARASSLVLDELHERTQSLEWQRIAAWACQLAGDGAGAERELTARWLQLRARAGGSPDWYSRVAADDLANFYCDEGRWNEAADLLTYCSGLDGGEDPRSHIVRARLAAHRGEYAEALALIEPVVESTERKRPEALNNRAIVQQALAEVQRAAGNSADAEAAVAKALALYEQKGNVAAAERVRASVPI